MRLTVAELIDKLKEYSPSLTVVIDEQEQIDGFNCHVLYQDLSFRIAKFEGSSSPKPYYKLVIEPIRKEL